jgi:hypothetical protein
MANNVTIGGVIVSVTNAVQAVAGNKIHDKQERQGLSAADKAKLFESAIAKLSNNSKFVSLPMTIDDPKQLSTYHSIDSLLQQVQERLEAYDMVDVFTLVHPVNAAIQVDLEMDGREAATHKLLTEYARLDVAQVAASNQWYHNWTEDAATQMHTNLNWSYHFLKNNIEATLMARLQPKYEAFETSQRGGPLLFMLLMQELLYTNESAVSAMKDQVEKYKISKVAGENVKNIAAILLSVSKRIWYSRDNKFPENYIDTIIGVLQTSSVPEFNEQFRTVALTRASDLAQERIAKSQGRAVPAMTYNNDLNAVETLFNMATTFYDQYSRDGLWAKYVKTKSNSGTATSSPSGSQPSALVNSTCFNCGSTQHMLPECDKPTDEQRIEANKKKYLEAKKKAKEAKRGSPGNNNNGSGSNGNQNGSAGNGSGTRSGNGSGAPTPRPNKWRPPDNGAGDQRFIWTRSHGSQPYKWNPQTRRWDLMVPIPSSNGGANSAGPDSTTSDKAPAGTGNGGAANTAAAPTPAPNTDMRAMVADLERQLQLLNAQL